MQYGSKVRGTATTTKNRRMALAQVVMIVLIIGFFILSYLMGNNVGFRFILFLIALVGMADNVTRYLFSEVEPYA